MGTMYYDDKTGWNESEDTIDEALESIRDDGRIEIKADIHLFQARLIEGTCDGENFLLVGPK